MSITEISVSNTSSMIRAMDPVTLLQFYHFLTATYFSVMLNEYMRNKSIQYYCIL